ncbi:MAG: amidohydrolase family protein [Chloroflexota bacterium]
MTTVTATQNKPAIVTGIIDGDGHIRERDEDLYPYFGDKYPMERLENYYLFPTLDGWRRSGGGRFGWDAQGWEKFMDWAGITSTVIYPTVGLGYAFAKDPEWAADLARAYNDFVYHHYLKKSSRVQAVAVIPVQDPPAAAKELHRAVTELGFVGGLLPTPGLRRYYGDAAFDPLYKVAQNLGAMLAVHGAGRAGIGLDWADDPNQGFVLSHTYAQISQFTNMVCERVWHRFPNLKVAFLEAGAGWAPYLIERIDRKNDDAATQQVRDCPIYFHAELEEKEVLPCALSVIGNDRFIYASDYPHETAEDVERALTHFLNRTDVTQLSKEKILRDNIKTLYAVNV